jgi:hypothetical protein
MTKTVINPKLYFIVASLLILFAITVLYDSSFLNKEPEHSIETGYWIVNKETNPLTDQVSISISCMDIETWNRIEDEISNHPREASYYIDKFKDNSKRIEIHLNGEINQYYSTVYIKFGSQVRIRNLEKGHSDNQRLLSYRFDNGEVKEGLWKVASSWYAGFLMLDFGSLPDSLSYKITDSISTVDLLRIEEMLKELKVVYSDIKKEMKPFKPFNKDEYQEAFRIRERYSHPVKRRLLNEEERKKLSEIEQYIEYYWKEFESVTKPHVEGNGSQILPKIQTPPVTELESRDKERYDKVVALMQAIDEFKGQTKSREVASYDQTACVLYNYYVKYFVKKLIQSERFVIGYTPERGEQQTAVFDTRGLGNAILPYLEDFGWDDLEAVINDK